MSTSFPTEVSMAKTTLEDIINGEVSRFLQALGKISHSDEVHFTIPGPEILLLPIRRVKEIQKERLVCTVL